jgi:CHAT domain-containing protein
MQYLPAVLAEIDQVRQYIPNGTFLINEEATRERILAELPKHTWLHFAGYGIQDQAEPDNSGLLCHDYQVNGPIRVADIMALRLQNGSLAFLSASDTALGVAPAVDEAIHIAGAFQIAGFAHVVGTQWPISDVIAPEIASQVYGELCGSSAVERPSTNMALALHHAVRQLRARYPQTPSLWAPYVHFGI